MLDMNDDDDVQFISCSNVSNLHAIIDRRKRKRLESAISSRELNAQATKKESAASHWEPSTGTSSNSSSFDGIANGDPLITTAYGQYLKTGAFTLPKFCEEEAPTLTQREPTATIAPAATAKSAKLPKIATIPSRNSSGAWAKVTFTALKSVYVSAIKERITTTLNTLNTYNHVTSSLCDAIHLILDIICAPFFPFQITSTPFLECESC